jgi:hypothetical protein
VVSNEINIHYKVDSSAKSTTLVFIGLSPETVKKFEISKCEALKLNFGP